MNPSPSGAMAPSESVDDVPSLWRRLWATVRDSLRPLALQPVHADWFSAAEVASYHRAKRSSTTADAIDDATWSDLQVDTYLRHVAVDTSLFGRQALVHRLRSGCAEPARSMGARAAREPATAAVLAAAASARRQLRCVRLDLVPALFDDALPVLPAWADRLWLVPLLLAAGVLLALLHSPLLGALVLMAWALVSAIFVARLSTPLRRWREIRDGLTTLLAAGREMAAAARLAPRPWLTELVDTEAALLAQWRRLAPNAMERLPAIAEYLNLVALYDYARMRRQLDAVRADLPDLRASFERIASADADLCLAGHLRDASSWCLAGKGAARQLSLQAMVHPLLAQAQPLSLQLDGQGLLITGHNGVGKSTLLRAVGLNLLAARGFGFCAHQIEARLRELAEQQRALDMARQLAAAQIQPHFLYNALASLQHWVQAKDDRAAPMLAALTGFLRATLPLFNRERLALGDEAEAARQYLAVMQLRLGERLRASVTIDPAAHAQRHATRAAADPGGERRRTRRDAGAGRRRGPGAGPRGRRPHHLDRARQRPRAASGRGRRCRPGQQPRAPGPGLRRAGHAAPGQCARRWLHRHAGSALRTDDAAMNPAGVPPHHGPDRRRRRSPA
jgi:hypothetical protein